MKKLFMFIVVLFILSACIPASSDVTHAESVDYLWGYEELRSGAVRVWLRHDNIAGYCTSDASLASKVRELNGELVKITFESSRFTDKESWNASGCSRLSTGYETSTPIFRLTDIEKWQE